MMLKHSLYFNLTQINPSDIKNDLTKLKDSGVIPELERTIAEYVGKKVQVFFKEVKEASLPSEKIGSLPKVDYSDPSKFSPEVREVLGI